MVVDGTVDMDGVTYKSGMCGDLVSALAACKGDVSCWNGKTVVPAKAHQLRCAPKGGAGGAGGTSDTCAPLPDPTSGAVVIMDESSAEGVWLQGKELVRLHHSSTVPRMISVFSDTANASVMVTLDPQGNVAEVTKPSTPFDWRKQLAAAAAAMRAHSGAWAYAEASCAPGGTHSTCDAETSTFLACADAFLGKAAPATCFQKDQAIYESLSKTPFGFNLSCK